MSVERGVVGESRNAFGVDVDGVVDAPKITKPPAYPDQAGRVIGMSVKVRASGSKVALKLGHVSPGRPGEERSAKQ